MEAEGNYKPSAPVFCTTNGNYIIPRNFNRKFYELCRKAGISGVNLHALRHTFATRLLEQGENIKVVQELLGHSKISTTADIYSHVVMEVKRQAVSRLNNLLSNGTKWAPKRVPAPNPMPGTLDFFGAENGTRTRDPRLGKPMLYQLSYFRIFTPLHHKII